MPSSPSAPVGTGLGNYAITYVTGSLTVNRAPLTITANPASKTYGDTEFNLNRHAFTPVGLASGDSVTGVTMTSPGTAVSAGVSGSPYDITPSAPLGIDVANYTITFVKGLLTVNPRPLTITANSRSKTYGDTVTFAGTEFTSSGTAKVDRLSVVTLTSPGAAATAGVSGSPYAITPSNPTGIDAANYTITYIDGTLGVTRANQTITFGALADKTLAETSVTIGATASSPNGVRFDSNSPLVCTVNRMSVALLTVGTCSITASQAGDTNWNAASPTVTQTFEVTAPIAPPTITAFSFASPAATGVIDQVAKTIAVSVPSGTSVSALVASFTTSTLASVAVGPSAQVSGTTPNNFSSPVTYTVTALSSTPKLFGPITKGDAGLAYVVTVTVAAANGGGGGGSVAPGPQTITSTLPAGGAVGTTVMLTGTASSGLAITYTSTTTSVCTVSGSTLSLLAAGTCSVTASQAGDGATWAAATPISASMTVSAMVTPPTTVPVLRNSIVAGVNRGTTGFATVSVILAKSGYVTFLSRLDPSYAGRTVQIWGRSRTGDWTPVTSRLVAMDGTVHYFVRIGTWAAFLAKLDAGAGHGTIGTVR